MGPLFAITLWLLFVAGITALWGRERFLRRLLLVSFISLLPFPAIPLVVSFWAWRKRLGPVEIWAPRLRPTPERERPLWCNHGIVEYEPWR